MSVFEILKLCRKNGIKLTESDGKLKISSKKGALTVEIKNLIKLNKENFGFCAVEKIYYLGNKPV